MFAVLASGCFSFRIRRTVFPDLDLRSSRCERIIAAFIATLGFDISSVNDNNCWFSNSMNWRPGVILLRSVKRGFQLTAFFCMSFILGSSSCSISR